MIFATAILPGSDPCYYNCPLSFMHGKFIMMFLGSAAADNIWAIGQMLGQCSSIGPGVLACATRGGGRSVAGHCFHLLFFFFFSSF